MPIRRSLALFALLATAASVRANPAATPPPLDFNRDVRPILNDKCFACHGPDEKSRKGKFRLDDRDQALKKDAIVPGKPEKSELVNRINSTDPDQKMPPADSHTSLSAAEIQTLTRWIKEGAPYAQHWSFVKPTLPAVPAAPAGMRVANPIDAFITVRLAKEGLPQSPPADPGTLLRRASLDLIGLPPTPAELDAFLADPSPNAYTNAIDRMLASPHFGERWARTWLDLARYADSTGYAQDALRPYMWPYRDWVINAFNRNVPYDQFTLDQLAGDLLPNPTEDQIVATAFHRNTMASMEGGIQPEEYRVTAVKDRVATTMEIWMGLTMGCAQCHTHKFDPITIKEYYQVFAIFNGTEDANARDESPRYEYKLPPRNNQAQRELLEKKIKQLEQQVASAKKPTTRPAAATTKPEDATAAKVKPLNDQLTKTRAQLKALDVVMLPVMRELPSDKRRVSHVLIKGNYLSPGEEVQPAFLQAFNPPSATDTKADRVTLAKWLCSPDNPLTARVTVNRFWGQLFGTGIVETQEDFGTQGTLPSHPELLDWLAVTFQTSKDKGGLGWDVKALLRLIVTSETYRQSSALTRVAQEKDPRDLLLGRYPRRRLPAETIRDQALAVAGLLSQKIGRPSVYPPQPAGLWQIAFSGGSKDYKESTGEDRYRRGLYSVWRRMSPPPNMTAFDAPSRETCTLRRQSTNTPIQAFVTLNDPVFVEAAQAFARRILQQGGGTLDAQLRFALKLVRARPLSDDEVATLKKHYEKELAAYRAQDDKGVKLATDPLGPLPAGLDSAQAAAMTSVANVLLNLDATLTHH